ncbi:MAG TPA: hypothetical protein VHL98_01020 [Microvirga sp.]|jgi:hypothetical protein|nr:hypothetical protein [Microvirga sp.]
MRPGDFKPALIVRFPRPGGMPRVERIGTVEQGLQSIRGLCADPAWHVALGHLSLAHRDPQPAHVEAARTALREFARRSNALLDG